MKPKLFSREIVGLFILFFSALSVAYLSGFTPPVMGHSAGEVQLSMSTYENDCTSGSADGSCVASCSNVSGERAVGGSCVSDLAFAFTGYGVTDALGNMVAWDCTDRMHGSPYVLKARVYCLKVGGVI